MLATHLWIHADTIAGLSMGWAVTILFGFSVKIDLCSLLEMVKEGKKPISLVVISPTVCFSFL